GCDEEAQRIVRLLQFKVGKTRKLRTQFHKTIRIRFKLPEKKQVRTQYRYSTVPDKRTAEQPAKKEKSYSYIIRY
ncbi:MAG: hypothetical protein KTR24_04830, partial [Saprospiraceae bacterium]|nr:hypothetical protein [Saprospiraceae bacterium]